MVALFACNSDHVLVPSSRAPGAASRSITVLGSTTIGVQSTNSTGSGGLPAFWIDAGGTPDHSTGITIPPNSAFRVIVTGRINVTVNNAYIAACNPTTVPGSPGSFGPLGSGQIWNELAVHLQLVSSSGASDVRFFHGQTGTTAPDSAASDYIFTSTGGVIYAGHAGMWGGYGQCGPNHDQSGGTWAMSGSQTIRVETVTDPVALTAVPNRVHAGDTVKFTMKRVDNSDSALWITSRGWTKDPGVTAAGPSCSVADNPCRRPVFGSGTMWATTNVNGHDYYTTAHVTVYSSFTLAADKTTVDAGDTVTFTPKYDGVAGAAAKWRWVPQDTTIAGTEPCANETSECKKPILESGTMWAYTSTTPGQGDSAGKAVTVTPRIKLACRSKDPTRGDPTTCTATAVGAGTLVITGWVFFPSSSISGNNGLTIDSIPRTTNVAATEWSGPMAASGVVRVTGTVAGVTARPGLDTISVQNRLGWSWANDKSATSADTGTWECSTAPHYATIVMGWAVGSRCGVQSWIFTPHNQDADNGIHVAPRIGDGPNTGLFYISSVTVALAMHAQVLKDLRADGSAYSFTNATDSATTAACAAASVSSPATITTVNTVCKANSDYQTFFNATWRHERCHMTVALDEFAAIPDARILAERVVAADSVTASSQVVYQQNGLYDAHTAIVTKSDSLDALPGSNYSLWFYSPTVSAWQLLPKISNNGIVAGC